MSFASDKLYNDYLRKNMGKFTSKVKVREIMPHLPCLTQSDKEEIEAKREQAGNYNSMQLLLDCLKRRENWPEELISALRECEHYNLAKEIEDKYNSLLVQHNPKTPTPATTVVRAHVHPTPTPNPSLPVPETSDGSAPAPAAQPAPLAEPASQPSPPVMGAVDPPAASQPSPPAMGAVDPPPAAQPSPPAMAAVDPPAASQPSPPIMAAVDPPAASQPSPPVMAAVDPPAASQPSPPLTVAVDPPAASQPSPPVMAAVDPPAASQPSPRFMAAVDPPAASQPSPPLTAAVDPPAASQASPPLTAAVDPPAASQPSPPVTTAVDPPAASQPSPPVTAVVDPPAASQASPPVPAVVDSPPAPLPSPPLRAAVDPHLEVAPASPEIPQQQPCSSVAPSDPTPPPLVTPIAIEIPPQNAPSPPVVVLQEVPTDDLLTTCDGSVLTSQVPEFDPGLTSEAVHPTDTPVSAQAVQIPTAPVEESQSPRTPPGQTDTSPTKFPIQDTAHLSEAVLPLAQEPVEDADPTIQVTRDYELAEASQPLTQLVSEPSPPPCWVPVDGADGPVSTLSDEYFSKPAPLRSSSRDPDSPATFTSIPENSFSVNSGCLEISGSVSGLDPDSEAGAPAVCTSVTSDPEVSVNPSPCQQNGVLEEDTPMPHNEPEENHFESTYQSSLGDQEVLTNVVHVFEEPSVLNNEGQTQSMMGNAVSSFEDPPVKNNDSQSQLILGDAVPESDDLHESVQKNTSCIADDSKSQILNGQATKEPIDPPVSDVTISVIAASSSDDSQNNELEEGLLEQETQQQEAKDGETIPLQNPIKPKNKKNYYLLGAAAVGVSALLVAWKLKN